MKTDFLAYPFSFVWPATMLLLLFCWVLRRRWNADPWSKLGWLAVLALVIVNVRVGGLPLGRWFIGLCANFSLPLLAFMASGISQCVFRTELLGKNGMRAAMGFVLVAGGVLYPMALGLGRLDPYTWGWTFSGLFVVIGVMSALLVWCGNRFGIVLLCAIAAYHLRLLESDNYWDYLVDPVCFLVAFMALATRLSPFRRLNSSPTT